jgi:uncharacterized protein YbjT (DUF2867 family)
MAEIILITGATGNIGGETLRQLAVSGIPVRALVRNRAKAASIDRPGVEIVEGDLENPETLGPALSGVTRALLVSSPEPRQAELQNNFIDAAKRHGHIHIVKLSAMGAATDSPVSFCRWHAATEQRLAQSGLPFTILRPTFFMQNTLAFAPTIAKEGRFYGSMKDGKASFVDLRDVAAVAAHTLTEPGHEGKIYEITGPETLSFSDIAGKLSAALGKPVAYIDLPRPALVSAMTGMGMPDWQANGIADLYDWAAKGGADLVTDAVEKVGKKKPISFDQFAADFRSPFESSATAR